MVQLRCRTCQFTSLQLRRLLKCICKSTYHDASMGWSLNKFVPTCDVIMANAIFILRCQRVRWDDWLGHRSMFRWIVTWDICISQKKTTSIGCSHKNMVNNIMPWFKFGRHSISYMELGYFNILNGWHSKFVIPTDLALYNTPPYDMYDVQGLFNLWPLCAPMWLGTTNIECNPRGRSK